MKRRIVFALVFWIIKARKNIQSMCQKILSKDVDLLLVGEEGKRLYDLIKYFNRIMYDHTLHRGRIIFVVIVYKLLVPQKKPY